MVWSDRCGSCPVPGSCPDPGPGPGPSPGPGPVLSLSVSCSESRFHSFVRQTNVLLSSVLDGFIKQRVRLFWEPVPEWGSL